MIGLIHSILYVIKLIVSSNDMSRFTNIIGNVVSKINERRVNSNRSAVLKELSYRDQLLGIDLISVEYNGSEYRIKTEFSDVLGQYAFPMRSHSFDNKYAALVECQSRIQYIGYKIVDK